MTDLPEGTDLRKDPGLRDLAAFAASFDDHPDTEELHRRVQTLLSEHKESTDRAELAAHSVDSPRHRAQPCWFWAQPCWRSLPGSGPGPHRWPSPAIPGHGSSGWTSPQRPG